MFPALNLAQSIAVWLLPVIFAITLHEVAHGWMAARCGDKTAWMLGRLTLNPLKHIDPIGTILIPSLLLISSAGFIFGWAKPVPVNFNNLRNPRRDMALVAIAGPMANVLMAVGWALLAQVGVLINNKNFEMIIYMGIAGITINLVLALVNLLPIPPLDGSRIIASLLPQHLARHYNKVERFGFIILLVMLSTGILGTLLGYPLYILQNIFYGLAGLPQ